MGYYHTSQVCHNGHVITDRIDSSPELSRKFCPKCGQPTITKCPNCGEPIQGDYEVPGVPVLGVSLTPAPAFCHACGKPFPWTERRLDATRELADLQTSLRPDERETLKKNLDDIITEGPRTTVAAFKIKAILARLGKESAQAFRDLLIDIVSSTAKKALWP